MAPNVDLNGRPYVIPVKNPVYQPQMFFPMTHFETVNLGSKLLLYQILRSLVPVVLVLASRKLRTIQRCNWYMGTAAPALIVVVGPSYFPADSEGQRRAGSMICEKKHLGILERVGVIQGHCSYAI